jgi:hypothetical protein
MRKRRILVVRGTHFKTDSANLIVVPITVVAIMVVAITVVAIMEVAHTIMVAVPIITGDPTGITAGTTDISESIERA